MENIVKIAAQKGYTITEQGDVFNRKGNPVKGHVENGYTTFSIRLGDKIRRVQFHRLQAYTKYGDALFEKGVVVRHLNGIKGDNTFINIAIGTCSDNMMDIPKEERLKKSKYAASFLRKHDKDAVRSFYTECKSYKKTMENFGISSKGTLYFILTKE